jgi:uncharacterized membrane protein
MTRFAVRPEAAFRKHLFASLASAAALCALAAPALAQPLYTIQAIAGGNCSPARINDRSWIAGNCDGTAVVWKDGVMTTLGRLPDGTFSSASSINASGVAVGDGDTGNGRPQSWMSTPSGLVNIFPNNGGNTHALFIGDNGFMGGYYTKSLSGRPSSWHGAIWTIDPKDPRKIRETDLPQLANVSVDAKASGSFPFDFNQLGQAAGYQVGDIIGQHAVFWDGDSRHTIVDLGVFGQDWTSVAWGINDLGQVVGESHPPASSRAVFWDNDAAHTVRELPPLPGDNYTAAFMINNLGQVVGTSAYDEPGTWNVSHPRYVIWRDGAVYDVESLLDPVSGAGWTITWVSGINNLGQMVGIGYQDGVMKVFLMTPQ